LHGVVIIAGGMCLWSESVPGVVLWAWLLGHGLLLLTGALWLVLVVMDVMRRGSWPRAVFLVAPLLVSLTFVALVAQLPLKARWAADRSAFDSSVRPGLPGGLEGVRRIGSMPAIGYEITSVWRVPEGVLFKEANGSFFDDAGFAYLPNGPSVDMDQPDFESPTFTHLGGPWYSWTASW
jgi:hypothetical protein